MNKGFVACVLLGGCTSLACAQDSGSAAGAGKRSGLDYVGETPGGHDIAVFTGQPSRSNGAAWHAQPRRTYGRLDDIGVRPGIGGFTLGHQYNFEYLARPDVGDPFHAGTAGKASNLVTQSGMPVDSGVRYYNTQFKHLSTGASYTIDTLGGDPMADRAWGMTIGFDYGPVSLRAAHQNRHVAQVHLYDLAGSNMDAKNSLIAANLHTRWGTAYAAYSANRGWGSSPLYNPDNPYGAGVASTSSTDSRDTLVGVAVPITRSTTFLASFIHKNDRDLANRDANQFAIGASYVVSRSTDFYAAFSRTVNTNGTGILIGGAARPSGSSAVNVGMRHAF
ncbi:porin [Massilia sp. GER05]|uniref:porin n=1 Tax=Massilia sp. GER05 TaxID=3394605 RepID=UPI003F83B11B